MCAPESSVVEHTMFCVEILMFMHSLISVYMYINDTCGYSSVVRAPDS